MRITVMKSFNLNSNIKVKLTEIGRQTIVDHYASCNSGTSRAELERMFLTDKTDADGYTELHAWALMDYFGHLAPAQFYGNTRIPLNSNILIDENDLEDV